MVAVDRQVGALRAAGNRRAAELLEVAAVKKATKTHCATLLAARELSRGVKRGLPVEAIERMMRQANVP